MNSIVTRPSYSTLLFLAAFLFPHTAQAAVSILFNHFTDEPRSYTRKVAPGDLLTVEIRDTCPGQFTYEYLGVLREQAEEQRTQAEQAGDADLDFIKAVFGVDCVIEQGVDRNAKTVAIEHKRKFGGYLIEIRKTDGSLGLRLSTNEIESLIAEMNKHCSPPNPAGCEAALKAQSTDQVKDIVKNREKYVKSLGSVTLPISVEHAGWDYELAGGFTFSDLVDEKFSLVSNGEGEDEVQVVIRERDREDELGLGLAGMIHLSHTKWPLIALSLGIGITEDSEANYFVGPSWRLGGKGFLTLGYNWGPVDTVPSGVRLSPDPRDPTTDPAALVPVSDSNVLNNLGSRTKGSIFLSLSYTFLSPGDSFFNKGFATADDTSKADQ